MPSDADQIANLDAELDALSSPTTVQVLAHTQDYDAGIVAASAARRALGAGGGGSQPDPLHVFTRAIFNFVETAGAGVYTASIAVPAGAQVNEVRLLPIAGPWDADSQVIQMGDVQKGADAYFDSNDGKSINDICGTPYNAANPVVDTNMANLATDGTSTPNGYAKAGWGTAAATSTRETGVRYLADDTITMTVTTTGAGGTTGHLHVELLGFGLPAGVVNAVKS